MKRVCFCLPILFLPMFLDVDLKTIFKRTNVNLKAIGMELKTVVFRGNDNVRQLYHGLVNLVCYWLFCVALILYRKMIFPKSLMDLPIHQCTHIVYYILYVSPYTEKSPSLKKLAFSSLMKNILSRHATLAGLF